MAEHKQLEVPVWTWRDAIRKAAVPPLTKHICNCIANYVSDVGKGCYPSAKALIADSGMSNRSVATHLQNAVDAGLLDIEREKGKDGRYGRSTYFPRFPENAVLMRRASAGFEADDDDFQVKELHADCPDEGGSLGYDDQVKELHVASPGEDGSLGPGEPGAEIQVKELHSKRTIQRELSTHTPDPSRPEPPPDVCVGGGKPVRGAGDKLGTKPPAAGAGGGVLGELRAEAEQPHVVEHLIAPLWGVLEFSPRQEPAALLRAIRDELAEFSDAALADAARTLRGSRTQWPSPAKAREAAQAAQARHMVRIEPGTTEWSAWVAEWHRAGRGALAKFYERQGFASVPRRFPALTSNPKPGKAA